MSEKEAEVSARPGAPGAEQKPAESTDQVAVMDPAAQLAAVAAERDHLVEEKAELQDRLLRRTAEFENYRRRVDREKSELRDFATMETIRQLLPVVDSFELALAAGCSDAEYARGMELILHRFTAELQKLGLEPISAEGKTFDPHLHHALEMRETAEAEEHAVLAELQKGYNFRGKLLRPALVRVAVARSSEKKAEQ